METMRCSDREHRCMEPKVASGAAPHFAGWLVVENQRRVFRGLDGEQEIGAVGIERLALLDFGVPEAFQEEFAKSSRIRLRPREDQKEIHCRSVESSGKRAHEQRGGAAREEA